MLRSPLGPLLLLLSPALPAQDAQQDKLCRMCHPAVAAATAKDAGPHAAVGCVGCHAALKEFDFGGGEHPTPLAKVDCATCHPEAAELWRASVHGEALRKLGLIITATCVSCDGAPGVRKAGDPDAP